MSSQFLESANRFVWSAWGELGVQGQEDRPFPVAIDLEPLIRLTVTAGREDPRLRSEAAAWVDSSPELVSKARLKRLAGQGLETPIGSERVGIGTGGAHVQIAGASAMQLRIRSALGVSARAEIIRQFIVDVEGSRRSASDLALLSGYTKRNIERALESLERGGWAVRFRGGTSLRWSVADHAALVGLFAPIPTSNMSFMALARIVSSMMSLDDVASDRVQVKSALARQLLAEQQPTADWGAVHLPGVPVAEDACAALLRWVEGLPASAL